MPSGRNLRPKGSNDMRGVSLSIASSVDVQGVSISTGSSIDVQRVSLSITSIIVGFIKDEYSARIYRPSFHENKPKTLVFT
jgi:hypothetical protein